MLARNEKMRAPRNRTIELTGQEIEIYRERLIRFEENLENCRNVIICGDAVPAVKIAC